MFLSVTKETGPEELANDNRNWTKIGENYFQSDNVNGITLEVNKHGDKIRWWVYDDNSSDPDLAVTLDDEDTLAKALAAAYDFLVGYQTPDNAI